MSVSGASVREGPPVDRWPTLIEVATVGVPFCVFKLCAGLQLANCGAPTLGVLLGGLGVVDLILNVVYGTIVAIRGRSATPICAFHAAISLGSTSRRRRELGLALDTMLSFSLVAVMIAFRQLSGLPEPWLTLWNVSVVLNVLGAGGMRLARAIAAAAPVVGP